MKAGPVVKGSIMNIVNDYSIEFIENAHVKIKVQYNVVNNQNDFKTVDSRTNTYIYKIAQPNEIYELIREGKDINYTEENVSKHDGQTIRGWYVYNISKNGYEKQYPGEVMPEIKKATMRNVFFDTDTVNFSNFKFEDNLVMSNCIFSNGDMLFCDSVFSNGANFSYTNFGTGAVLFNNTIFEKGIVNFGNTYFNKGDTQFYYTQFRYSNVSFMNAVFGELNGGKAYSKQDFSFQGVTQENGEMYFYNTLIGNENVYFNGTDFGNGLTTFTASKFNGKGLTSFENCIFGSDGAYFTGTNFYDGSLNFEKTKFISGDISFCDVDFGKCSVDFNRTDFGKCDVDFQNGNIDYSCLIFSKVIFKSDIVSFHEFKANESILMFDSCIIKSYMDLRLRSFKDLALTNCTIENVINMAYEIDSNTTSLNLSKTINLGSINIPWRDGKVLTQIQKNNVTNRGEVSNQLRMLKENYRNLGQYENEDKCYFELKKSELEIEGHVNNTEIHKFKNKLLECAIKHPFKSMSYWFKLLVFQKIGGYGTKPGNVLRFMIATVIVFALLYSYVPIFKFNVSETETLNLINSENNIRSLETLNPKIGNISNMLNAIYYSGITFLTIGYGDIHPANMVTKIASVVEGFLGIFLMSYFTVAFVRKLLR